MLKLSQSTVSMVFSCILTEKFPSSLNERQRLAIISHDDSVYNFVYFIKMKDYVVKTMRSLRAAWNSRNTLEQFSGCSFKLIWLYENTGAMDELPRSINSKKQKISHWQGKKVTSEWRLFSKTNFLTCRSTYHSSCYGVEFRTSKNSDELRACIEKVYVVVTFSE